MAKNTSIALNDHFQTYIRKKVESGKYESASEVVREGLRLLERQDETLDLLLAELDAGEASGPAVRVSLEEFLRDVKKGDRKSKLRAKAQGKAGSQRGLGLQQTRMGRRPG